MAVPRPRPSSAAAAEHAAELSGRALHDPDVRRDAGVPYMPGAQPQMAAPAAESLPDAHSRHALAPAVLPEKRPASHAVHVAALEVVLPSRPKRPSGHALPLHAVWAIWSV